MTPKSPTNPSNDTEYLGEIGGVPVIKDPKATEPYFRNPLASDPKPSNDELQFDSNFEPAKPHVIVFEIIRQAIRNGDRFEVEASNTVSPNIVYKLSIGDDVDEYIERLINQSIKATLEGLLEKMPTRSFKAQRAYRIESNDFAAVVKEKAANKVIDQTKSVIQKELEKDDLNSDWLNKI